VDAGKIPWGYTGLVYMINLDAYLKWFKAHEKLIIIALGAWLAFHFYGDILNAWVDHDKRNVALQTTIAQAAAQKVQSDTTANQQLVQQLTELKTQYAALSSQVAVSMQKRQQDTQEQKKKNDNSTSSEVAIRTATLLRVDPKEINADATEAVLFSSAAAHANINALEDGISAAANVLDLNKKLVACEAVSKKQDETITGAQSALVDEKASHQADNKLNQKEIQLAKDEGKKQFRRGFKWGFITGAVATGTVTILKIAKII